MKWTRPRIRQPKIDLRLWATSESYNRRIHAAAIRHAYRCGRSLARLKNRIVMEELELL